MDNLCHSLVGAALSEAGLKKRTALATATLVIGANLPDVDVLAYAWGPETALGFRRGWTHGVLALAFWPFVLTGIMLAWDRLVRLRRRPGAEPASPGELLILSVISILTHPFLDWLNTYGMRWLMPFRDVWYYGDTLFIIDVWIWLALGIGWLWSRLRRTERPARVALAAVCVYILLMGGSQLAARQTARESLADAGANPERLMAGPLPVTPFRRQIVAETGDVLHRGTVDWLRQPAFVPGSPAVIPENAGHPAIAAAAATPQGAIFLHWARFPFFLVEERPERWIVRMTDARYTINPGTGFGALTVEVPREEVAGRSGEKVRKYVSIGKKTRLEVE
ncbi:MAG TPA: metal-dependent hydrolase [Thermoanaerobaculia bacterium]|nr:metal-dependent hydrolase [Thermoanaerobaculia bacterium]